MNDVTRTSKELVIIPTPRTDAAASDGCVSVEFAMTLEAELADALRTIAELRAAHEPTKGRKCMADMYADPPQDCNAPYCGCNPAWSECMSMLQECGWKSPEDLRASQPPGDVPGLLHTLEVLRQRWSHNVNFEATIGACITEIELCVERAARATSTKSAECGACDKPGEHCSNQYGICSRAGGHPQTKSEQRDFHALCGTCKIYPCQCTAGETSCGCWDCSSMERRMSVMITCPECGNKRCPKATSHLLACTNSNEPGQTGSRYYFDTVRSESETEQ